MNIYQFHYYLSVSGHVHKTLLSKIHNLSKSVDVKTLSTRSGLYWVDFIFFHKNLVGLGLKFEQ